MSTKDGVSASTSESHSTEQALRKRVATLEAALKAVTAERDKLRRAYEQLKAHLELLKRRIFVAKAERIDTAQLELEFAATKARLDALAQRIEEEEASSDAEADESTDGENAKPPPSSSKTRPAKGGRPDLRSLPLTEERVEILDPALEETAERIGFEETCLLGYRRAHHVRVVVARATYKTKTVEGSTELVTAPKPKELYERAMLAPSCIAHVLVQKYRFGIPFYRVADSFAYAGVRVDDSTMCRYAEHVGASLGPIVDACAQEARETAFCLSTDATGVSIQPERLPDRKRQPCAKGHFFVVLADKDHVFFEYQAKHTSAAVCSMFRGFSGYIQADAHCVYDALFRGDAREREDDEPPSEVGCWSHARRKFWEAAVATKDSAAREGLLRIRALFKLEQEWASLPPKERHARRQRAMRPMLDEFFVWAEAVFETVRAARGLVATAFGYVVRHREAFCRVLDDGRLRLDNNASERALRHITIGRKAWLFFGSDDHAQAAANLFSLIASCKLHGVDPESYLADVIRIFPYWPRDRYLELAPKYWLGTRARLDAAELERAVGHITVPPPAST